jgi:hypothetical protein
MHAHKKIVQSSNLCYVCYPIWLVLWALIPIAKPKIFIFITCFFCEMVTKAVHSILIWMKVINFRLITTIIIYSFLFNIVTWGEKAGL